MMAAMERSKKRELRELNTRAWKGDKDVFTVQSSLDSNMKKNTAFIKRLRTAINPAGVGTFLQEIRSLSLHKYLTEIVSACFEGLCKLKVTGEIAAGVEIVSALHQRFGPEEFTCFLGWLIGRGLSTPDKAQLKALSNDIREREEKERIARQRILLRVATELWLVGVLKSLEDVTRPEEANKVRDNGKVLDIAPKSKANGYRGDAHDPEPFPLEVLKDMLGHDREHVNLPLVVLFVKSFAYDILGTQSMKKEGRQVVAEDGATSTMNCNLEAATSTDEDDVSAPQETSLTSLELQQRFRNILLRYFEDVKSHLSRDQKQLMSQGKRNAEAYVKSGEVFEDRQANYEKAMKAQEKLIASTQTLAEALGADMPDLAEKGSAGGDLEGNIGLVKTGEYLRGHGDGAGIWEDEDERRFYENLTDLKDRVPGILLEDNKKKKGDDNEQVGKKLDETVEKAEAKPAENDEAFTAIANKTVGAQVDALLAHLVDLNTKDQVDQFAIDFCFLNSKASRNRLVKSIEEIPKGRTDLLPLYARLVATLGRYLTDIPQGITTYLDDEFRSLQRRKSKDFLGQVRMVNVRYIAELTKFGVVPEHVIFHCLKVGMDEFSRMNIEIIATLLENCGRYLLRNPETSPRMASFLETLQRKKTAQHPGQQERMLIENAVYYVNPPERAAIQQKERTTLDLYVRKLVGGDLNKKSLEKVIKQIRKLHWEEPEVVEVLRKIFVKPGKIKFANIHLLAIMLGALYRFHTDFAISVMDDILERITVGLETNDFKYNQRRIAEVKYLGELYIYRMVDSSLIFDTLFKLLNYGHEGYIQPGRISPLDLPDDFFRIRLASALLETCGVYFEKGAVKKKLEFFLTFLQYYINVKDPLPMDMEFVVQDLYNLLRPQWKLILNDLGEASKTFAEACKLNYQNTANGVQAEPDEPEDLPDEGDHSDDARVGVDDAVAAEGEANDGKSDEEDGQETARRTNDSDEEEHIIVTRPEEQRDPEADADFDRELAKLMAESAESRKFDRKQKFDLPLPMRRTVRDVSSHVAEDSGNEAPPPVVASAPSVMTFSLLSKKGNRQHTRAIDMPSDSNLAVAMRTQQEHERAEQQRIKNVVLNLDFTNNDESQDGEQSAFHYVQTHNSSRARLVGKGSLNRSLPLPRSLYGGSGQSQRSTSNNNTSDDTSSSSPPAVAKAEADAVPHDHPRHDSLTDSSGTFETIHGQPRLDKSGNTRSKQRARKLQLGDIDWYGNRSTSANSSKQQLPQNALPASLDNHIVDKSGGVTENRGRSDNGSER